MKTLRKIPFLSCVVSPFRSVKINLSGCNFNCLGCFAIAKDEKGWSFSVEDLINFLIKSSKFIYKETVGNIQLTGGEPILYLEFLFSLIEKLKKENIEKISISTNGYLLNKNVVKKLKFFDVALIKLDLKAYTDRIHLWYTGKSNKNILRAIEFLTEFNLNFYVRTIYIPNIIDCEEIEKIAKFLNKIDKNINYKIYQFAQGHSKIPVSRTPSKDEMQNAYNTAKEYLNNVSIFTTETAYTPDYKCIEIRCDDLIEEFKRIDEISKKAINTWDIEYYTFSQILKERN